MSGFDRRFSLWGEIIGDPLSHALMTAVVHVMAQRRTRPLRILEVGAWIGGSAATWSEALSRHHPPGGTILCVDPWIRYPVDNAVHGAAFMERYMAALDEGEAFRRFLQNIAALPHPVHPLRAPSDTALPLLRDGSFDIVYVDGDHSYDACRGDLAEARRLVAPGGIVCGDDMDCLPQDVDAAFLAANRNKQPAIHPVTGAQFHPGVTLAVAEAFSVSVAHGFWCTERTPDGFAALPLAGLPVFVPQRFGAAMAAEARQILAAG